MRHILEPRSVVAAMTELGRLGLNQGTSGNVGLRVPDGVLVTPSGVPFDRRRHPIIPSPPWKGAGPVCWPTTG
jgi:L-fuculose-phosphate aldolase